MRSQKDGVEPLRQRLLKLLAKPKYQPLNKTDLAKRLGVPVEGRAAFRRLLRDLERERAKSPVSGKSGTSYLKKRTLSSVHYR
jgi:hypothetical protein